MFVYFHRNVVFAPAVQNYYSGASFPALVDSLFGIEMETGNSKAERWKDVRKQISVITYFIHAAAKFLNNFDEL